jgi:hypothetical protein
MCVTAAEDLFAKRNETKQPPLARDDSRSEYFLRTLPGLMGKQDPRIDAYWKYM